MSDQTFCANITALFMLLVDKGIVTPKEIETYVARATTLMDQQFAIEKDLYLKELSNKK